MAEEIGGGKAKNTSTITVAMISALLGAAGMAGVEKTGLVEISDGNAIVMAKSKYVKAAEMSDEAKDKGAAPVDTVDGVPIITTCNHNVKQYEMGTAVVNDTDTVVVVSDSTVVGDQLTRAEWKSGYEFVGEHMVVCRMFDVDSDGNWSFVQQYQYPLSIRSDGWIYTVAMYPVITPNPPRK